MVGLESRGRHSGQFLAVMDSSQAFDSNRIRGVRDDRRRYGHRPIRQIIVRA